MTRLIRMLGGAALVLAALLASGAPAGATLLDVQRGPQLASVDDFTIDSFDADYTLGRDQDGRSTLRTVERIVARFPDFDQNRGLIRDLTRVYDGHGTDLRIVSVTDERGEPRAYTTKENGDFLSVTMAVPVGSYVHGAQTYVIEYAQRDVTKRFADTRADEFYWEVNGTGWQQPFGGVSARVVLEDDLAAATTGEQACYRGRHGSTQPCAIARDGSAFRMDEAELWPQETVTFSIGFAEGTFSERPFSLFERIPPLTFSGFASAAAAILLAAWSVTFGRRGARSGRAVIVQYEPEQGVDAATAAQLVGEPSRAMTATLLDLAVRGRIRLLSDGAGERFGAIPIDDRDLSAAEQMAFSAIQRGAASDGTSWFGRSAALGDAAASIRSHAAREVERRGFVRGPMKWVGATVPLLGFLALGLLVVHAIRVGDDALIAIVLAVGINAIVWFLVGFFAVYARVRRRTPTGALAHDHLMGLREYIRLAEADRIAMLQSSSGAEVDAQRIVRVYERLLPYAVIFGYEDEWQAELARYYATGTPSWIDGSGQSFTGMSFAQMQTSVASSPVTHVPSASSSSSSSFSSSGGSSGGGSAGGGGGGGGGGGI